LEFTRIQNGEKTLEVALGRGLNFVEILKRNPNGWVNGIDVSMMMVEKAKKRISETGQQDCTLHLCHSRRHPLEDEMFDAIMNQYLLDIFPAEISSLFFQSSSEF
jgi:ubiquinone/menaquinone biosynthesis C-methylase UbiE